MVTELLGRPIRSIFNRGRTYYSVRDLNKALNKTHNQYMKMIRDSRISPIRYRMENINNVMVKENVISDAYFFVYALSGNNKACHDFSDWAGRRIIRGLSMNNLTKEDLNMDPNPIMEFYINTHVKSIKEKELDI